MADTTAATAATPKAKKATASAANVFDPPKFEIPKFDMPSIDMPAAFREFADKGLAQAKENYDKVKSVAEQATEILEDTYSTCSKGCADHGLKLIEAARANTNAALDLYGELLTAKSYAEVVERTTSYLRAQFESLSAQTRELAEHAQKVATDSVAPVKECFSGNGKAAA